MILRVVAAAVLHQNQLLGARRKQGQLAGFWELPGGKREPGEDDKEALAREISEELGLDIEVGKLLGEYEFKDLPTPLTLAVYYARTANITPKRMTAHDLIEWIPLENLNTKKWAPADEPAIAALSGLLSS